ncbi:MAG: two-component regulator propeller domain-containing protein [Pyrinomonadaceae bacterium]
MSPRLQQKGEIRLRLGLACPARSYLLPIAILFLLLAATVPGQRLPVKTYSVADGLLRDYVYKIRQDSRGFLWFCTPGGLSRFDGYSFTNFTNENGLPGRYVNDFLETRSGTIWVATSRGLARLDPNGTDGAAGGKLFSAFVPDDLRARNILNLFEDAAGNVFAGTGDGLFRVRMSGVQIELEKVSLIEPGNGFLEITAIIGDRHGALWLGTFSNGLIRVAADGRVDQFSIASGLPGSNIESLLVDNEGRLWVGMRAGVGSGLCLLVKEPSGQCNIVERTFTVKDGLPDGWILSLHQAADGQLWVGTIKGLCRWQGDGHDSVCKTFTTKNDICDSDIWDLTADKDGNLWMGTRCGAKKLARYGFTTYTKADGVDPAFINSIFENYLGDLFASFDPGITRTVSRFNGESFELAQPRFPADVVYYGWGTRQTVWQDRTGDWLIPTALGLYRYSGVKQFKDLESIEPQKVSPIPERMEIFRLFEDSRGDLWIATTVGPTGNSVWRWDRAADAWHDLGPQLGFNKDRLAWAFVEDHAGNIWISTTNDEGAAELVRYRNGTFEKFDAADGIPKGIMEDLFVDENDRLWIASSSAGLLRIDDVNASVTTFIRYSSAEGLSTDGASCVTQDKFGRMYICTGRGLDRLDPSTGRIESFTTADGMPNSYPVMAYRDRSDTIWIGTTDGLARLAPEPPRIRQPPNVLITGLRIGGIARNISVLGETEISGLDLNSDERQVTVDFVGLGATLGEKLKYEYRFAGSDWTPTAERTLNFANLSAGSYRFEIRAATADAVYSPVPATLTMKIEAPLWRQWWFLATALILAMLAIYLFYRTRFNRLLQIERMRTRIATDLHDDVGANLTRISLMSEVARRSTSNDNGELLTSIANIARESVASMNDIVWAISPDHDSLLDLTRRMRQHAEEVFVIRDIDLDFRSPHADADLRLSVSVRRDVLLIFKEAVSNAARHSDCSRVKIDFGVDHSHLFLRVEDNGRGFNIDPEKDGHGLRSMTRRGEGLGGTLKMESLPGRGTVVQLDISLPKASLGERI